MTRTDTSPIDAVGTITHEPELWSVDPDVEELFLDIEEILCAALRPRPCPPPAPGATGDTARHPAPGAVRTRIRKPEGTPGTGTTRATQRAPPTRNHTAANESR